MSDIEELSDVGIGAGAGVVGSVAAEQHDGGSGAGASLLQESGIGGEAHDRPSGAAPRGPSGDARGAGGEVKEDTPAEASAPSKSARIRCLDQVKTRGFTFAKGKVVEGVPLGHAEYLVGRGKAEILEVL